MYQVLIVDDEKIIRMGMKRVITWEQAGVDQVFTAESAEQALQLLQEEVIHILITDIEMSCMNGLDLIKQVNELYPAIRIIVVTGYDEFEYAHKCLKMQVEDFLLKPVDEEDMTEIIKRQTESLKTEQKQQKLARVIRRVIGSKEQIQLNQIMCELLKDQKTAISAAKKVCETYQYNLQQVMQAAVLVPQGAVYEKTEEEKYLSLAIRDFCNNNIDLRERGVTFLDEGERIVIAYFLNGENDSISFQIEELIQLLRDEFDISQKIVLGSVVTGFAQFRISYNDALLLLENEQQDYQNIIQDRQRQDSNQIFREVFGEIKNIIAVNQGDPEKIMYAFATFSKMTESYNLPTEHIRRCCFELAMSVYYTHIANHGEIKGDIVRAYTEMIVSAQAEETLEETRTFIERMHHKEEENIPALVKQAQSYIRNHLAEDLSVTGIAQMLYLTPSYFSRLFNKAVHEGCNDYIVRQRMENAQYLLESTSLKTGEIALIVGYHDKNYFSLAFKKYSGVSPTAYREKARINLGGEWDFNEEEE